MENGEGLATDSAPNRKGLAGQVGTSKQAFFLQTLLERRLAHGERFAGHAAEVLDRCECGCGLQVQVVAIHPTHALAATHQPLMLAGSDQLPAPLAVSAGSRAV